MSIRFVVVVRALVALCSESHSDNQSKSPASQLPAPLGNIILWLGSLRGKIWRCAVGLWPINWVVFVEGFGILQLRRRLQPVRNSCALLLVDVVN